MTEELPVPMTEKDYEELARAYEKLKKEMQKAREAYEKRRGRGGRGVAGAPEALGDAVGPL